MFIIFVLVTYLNILEVGILTGFLLHAGYPLGVTIMIQFHTLYMLQLMLILICLIFVALVCRYKLISTIVVVDC